MIRDNVPPAEMEAIRKFARKYKKEGLIEAWRFMLPTYFGEHRMRYTMSPGLTLYSLVMNIETLVDNGYENIAQSKFFTPPTGFLLNENVPGAILNYTTDGSTGADTMIYMNGRLLMHYTPEEGKEAPRSYDLKPGEDCARGDAKICLACGLVPGDDLMTIQLRRGEQTK